MDPPRIPRFFNTAGPCVPANHYVLPTERRLPDVRRLIDRSLYFVLHAPRQVGKTTSLLALACELTEEGQYAAALVSMEPGAGFPDDVGMAEDAVLSIWRRWLRHALPAELQPPPWPEAPAGARLHAALASWTEVCPRPLVLFLDEIDALQGEVLISVLRQLRDGHRTRPRSFPWSLALVGLRDVRDYEIRVNGQQILGTASPFNIKSRSLTLRDFTREEVVELYGQHTTETGQVFEDEAVELAYELTRGQPWLVNALAGEAVDATESDRRPITADDIARARDTLIARQDTHIDSLGKRLREPRVRAVIEPMLAGAALGDIDDDDLRFVIDLGLVRATESGLEIANPIYREIVVRRLYYTRRRSLPELDRSWLDDQGRLQPDRLLASFLAFWRRHGEPLMRCAGPPTTRSRRTWC